MGELDPRAVRRSKAAMIPRLFYDGSLLEQSSVPLTTEQAHYLRNVMRRENGAEIRLFNSRDGEFSARLSELSKKSAIAAIEARLRAPEVEPDIELLIAPVKRAALEYVIQKGTELGAKSFVFVTTDRTNAERIRLDRLQSIALEAAEQCDRLSVPELRAPQKLAELLLRWDKSRTLYFCDEAGDDPSKEWGGKEGRAAPLLQSAAQAGEGAAAILIGPEGGFTPNERSWLQALPFVRAVTLGPRILRADTAAIVALGLWQAAAGDFRRTR